jgi:hypothetical protein
MRVPFPLTASHEGHPIIEGGLFVGTNGVSCEKYIRSSLTFAVSFATTKVSANERNTMAKVSIPKADKHDSRICFGISYFKSEKDADKYAAHVKKLGLTYNGGWFHGMPCGRDKNFDHVDRDTGVQLYAVTD